MNTTGKTTRFPLSFFLLSFGITWLIWLPGILSTQGLIRLPIPFIVFFFIGTWGPFLSALWASYREGGWNDVKAFIKRGLNFRFPWIWLLIIIVVALLVSAAPLGLYIFFGGKPPQESLLFQPLMIIPVFMTYFITGGGNEEWGWRGYALDRLQSRWNPTVASLVLGIIWGLWHVPLFFIEDTGQYHMSLLVFLIAAPALSVLHTWVYNSTGKNLFAAWLLHSILGTGWEVFPIVQPQLEGYRSVHIYDFSAVLLVAIFVLLIDGPGLGIKKSYNTGSLA